ncbi:hypothetical protein PC39_14147 [Salinisphaera sp. PC39]|uniref:DUF6940 family protein n=1 Tax=Salinisphaera sp. PC39 TaxID=1304156 RepID=UPI003341CA81
MWHASWTTSAADRRRLAVHGADGPLSAAAVLRRWRDDDAFRGFWNDTLKAPPFAAYAWEMPPLARDRLDRPFECVFVDNPALAATGADPGPFEAHFRAAGDADSVTFDNLGNDARLVAPCPRADPAVYSHLAVFAREAPDPQARALWAAVAAAADERLKRGPFWLSTAGLGVYWLHVRLDDRPKYYRHRPYARVPA